MLRSFHARLIFLVLGFAIVTTLLGVSSWALIIRPTTEALLVALACAAITSAVLALALGRTLERLVTRPLRALSSYAERVARGEPAQVDLEQLGADEFRDLGRSLESMFDQLSSRTRSLDQSVATLQALIEASPVAIIGVADEGHIAIWNAQAQAIFGLTMDEALGKPVLEALDRAELREVLRRCLADAPVVDAEVILGVRSSTPVDLIVSSAPLRGPEGRRGAIILVSDVTERHQAQLALAEREQQLHRAQQLELVGRLAGGLAHDFNNLLMVIMTSASLIEKRTKGDAVLNEMAASVSAAAERASVLTKRLLGFSKHHVDERIVLDLNHATRDLLRMIGSAVGERIELAVELDDQQIPALIDVGRLEQVLLNLVINARDAMPQGGTLTLRTFAAREPGGAPAPGGPWVALAVGDTGVGMSPEVRARATEFFFTTKRHGTGLGLATTSDIVRAAGGWLTLDSVEGRGTTAIVWLPRAEATPIGATGARVARPERDVKVVLLVDDEAPLRVALRQVLIDAGYKVHEAASGKEALATVASIGPIDALVTDVVMRGMTGPQLAHEVTRRHPALPVIYMSGYVGDALDAHGLSDETVLLQKPFAPDVLVRELGALLDARGKLRLVRGGRADAS